MKQLIKSIIYRLMYHAPWGVRDAALDAIADRMGYGELSRRVFPRLHITEIGVSGDYGVICSAANDRLVLPEYGRTGTFEKVVVREILDYFDGQAGTYLDIGANIGLTTIPVARNPRIQCLAFEPEPTNFHFLQRNVTANITHGNVEFHQLALLDRRSTVSLAISDGNLGDHRVTISGVAGRRSIEVPAVPLDDFLPQLDGAVAAKVDTQGAEPFIVAGGRQVFDRAGLVVMEFCPFLMRQLGGDPEIVIQFLAGFDRVAVVADETDVRPEYHSVSDAQDILRRKLRTARNVDYDYVDIIARRGA